MDDGENTLTNEGGGAARYINSLRHYASHQMTRCPLNPSRYKAVYPSATEA